MSSSLIRPPTAWETRYLGNLLRDGFEREIPGYELPTDGDLLAYVLSKYLPRCQHRTMLVPMTDGLFLKEALAHGGYKLTYRGDLYCPFCSANHLRLLRGRLLSWWCDAELYLQLNVRNLRRLEKARERAGDPLYRWFRSQGLTAFTSAPLGKMWSDIELDRDSLEGVLDTVLLGIELNVPQLKDDLRTYRNRPTDGSREWSKEAYVEENYRTDGETPKVTGKPIFVSATLDHVIAKAHELGIHVTRHFTSINDGESTGRSAFAHGLTREKMSGLSSVLIQEKNRAVPIELSPDKTTDSVPIELSPDKTAAVTLTATTYPNLASKGPDL